MLVKLIAFQVPITYSQQMNKRSNGQSSVFLGCSDTFLLTLRSLQIQHDMLTRAFDNKLILAPVDFDSDLCRVLEIGTGTG